MTEHGDQRTLLSSNSFRLTLNNFHILPTYLHSFLLPAHFEDDIFLETLNHHKSSPSCYACLYFHILQSMVACLPSLLSRLNLPQFDMQENVWAQIILKVVDLHQDHLQSHGDHLQTSSLALAFFTMLLTLSVSRVKAALPCFIVCFYLKVLA